MPSNDKKTFLGLVARGLGMGAADVVPGVSGGTIAFITGIYEELIETISNLKLGLLKTWRKEGFKAMWAEMNGNFLIAIFLGVIVSFLSLAKVLKWLLEDHPILLWSFFFGLILASVWMVGKTVDKWNGKNIAGFIAGAVVAFLITTVTPAGDNGNMLYIFLSGALAICAMILPGISGSFILLLLGAYGTIIGSISGLLDALSAKDWGTLMDHGILLAIFAFGCLFGLIAFSKLLNWLFKKAKMFVIAILTGFLLGSLNKIWPWKETLSWRLNSHDELVPLHQVNITPGQFSANGTPNQLMYSILLMIAGIGIIILLDRFGNPKENASS